MSTSTKVITDNLRNEFIQKIIDHFSLETDIIRTASGTVYLPTTDENGDDRWVKISVIVPKASEEDGTDGYSLGEEYNAKIAEQAEKKAKAEKAKAKKIAQDKKMREEKADAKKKKEED